MLLVSVIYLEYHGSMQYHEDASSSILLKCWCVCLI